MSKPVRGSPERDQELVRAIEATETMHGSDFWRNQTRENIRRYIRAVYPALGQAHLHLDIKVQQSQGGQVGNEKKIERALAAADAPVVSPAPEVEGHEDNGAVANGAPEDAADEEPPDSPEPMRAPETTAPEDSPAEPEEEPASAGRAWWRPRLT